MNTENTPTLFHDFTNEMTGLSASSDTLDSILPVQLDEETLRDYQSILFPPRKTPKGMVARRQHYPELYTILGEVSAVVNMALAQARFIYMETPILAGSGLSSAALETHFMRNWSTLSADFSDAVATVREGVRVAMSSASTGQAHIIVPSNRYKGGMDVVYSGVPNGAYGRTSTVFMTAPATRNEMPQYQTQLSDVVLNSNYVGLATSIADTVNKWLFHTIRTAAAAQADVRVVHQLRIQRDMWDVTELEASLSKLMVEAGFKGGFGKFPFHPKINSDLIQGVGKYFSFVVIKEPNHTVLGELLKRPNTTIAERITAQELPRLQAEYGLSIAMNLPEDVAAFITQTPVGQRIPLAAMNTWVNTWSRALIKSRGTKLNSGSGDRLTPANAPRYILKPSATPDITERRKELGLNAEVSRGNEDNLYINSSGRFNFCPTSADVVVDNAKSYEEMQEKALELSFSAGAPLITSQSGYASNYFAYSSPEYKESIKTVKANLGKYAGALQTYSWDYNCILTSSRSDPDRLVSIPLTGASRPDALAISEYLTKPAAESLVVLFPDNRDTEGKKELTVEDMRSEGMLLRTKLMVNVQYAYQYLLYMGKAPDLQTLITRAAKALDLTSVDPTTAGETNQRYESNLYTTSSRNIKNAVITNDLKVLPTLEFKAPDPTQEYDSNSPSDVGALETIKSALTLQTSAVMSMLGAAMEDASGTARSNLMRVVIADGGSVEDDEHYFDMKVHNLGEMAKVYNYLGGRVFYEMLQVLLKADTRDLAVVDTRVPFAAPSFESIVKEVKPFATLLGKYAPDRESINNEAEEIIESLKKDDSVTTDDINLPGSKDGFQMFPHQAETFKTLGQERPPRFATLDIAPGGGKTIIGLTDIGNLIHRGLIKRPVVMCPNGLVRNWIEDMHSVTEGKWNIIPITTYTYKTWGEERLTKLIQTAPINTIFVVGLSFLRLNTYQIVIGNHAEKVSGTLEFCKKFGFDYVILDESHKAKNTRSHTHKAIKQLTVASTVKYVRLATGTLIQTKLTDVVGQAALYGAHIFRTQEEYEAENSVSAGSGSAVVFAADASYRARRQLSKHSAVISFKRKEWAFLLPRPIESFMSVRLDGDNDEFGAAHQMMYQALLNETVAEIKADKTVMGLLNGKSDEDGDEAEDESEEDETPEAMYARAGKVLGSGEQTSVGGLPITTNDLDDAQLAELEAALQPYLARLEQMLTDPMGDPAAAKYFQILKKEDYVSRKVRKIIERIDLNFRERPWKKGETYNLKDIADYNGTRYVLMGKPGEKLTLESYEETYVSVISPDKDPRWKTEPFGKVIVFCRYTRSVNAIMRALPPHLAKLAVPFSGGVKNKWQNLEDFRTTPFSKEKGVQILVANEQAISEGHNLQMASRIVRVESPWSPGELDQSSARIFRPDTTGQFRRENVYLDWVLCNNTLEVAKLGRLISRMVDKAKFDEADNPLYQPLADKSLFPISMSLETIAATPLLEDISEYMESYIQLVRIQSAEFEEMRQTKPSSMLPIETTPMPEGSAILEHVPYLPSLKSVPDRHNYDLTKLTMFLQDSDADDSAQVNADKQLLVGMYAHTEFGNGMIVKVREAKSPDGPSKLTSVTVQLANGDMYTADPAMIYLAQNITKDNVKDFTPKERWATKADQKKAAREEAVREKERLAEEERLAKQSARESKAALRAKKLAAAEKLAAASKKLGKKKAPVKEEEEEPADPLTVDLYPVVYNGYLAIEATPGEDDEADMKSLGFKDFGEYAFLQIKDKVSFDATLAWLDKKFYLRRETRKRLETLAESFMTGRGRKFSIELAPVADFRNFYNISHKMSVKDKDSGLPELKIYPVIINGALFLNVDISTNPIIRKYLNKMIPGTKSVKFEEADGLWIQFFRTRAEVIAWTKKIRADGVEITNYEAFKKSVDDLKDKLKIMQKLTK